jgi:hypothetical protein
VPNNLDDPRFGKASESPDMMAISMVKCVFKPWDFVVAYFQTRQTDGE